MAQEPTQRIYQVLLPNLRSVRHPRHPIYVLVALACLLIVGCANSSEEHGAKAEAAARIAQKMVGVRYAWGGAHPRNGFDCSGLVYYSYNKVGIAAPRTTKGQHRQSRSVSNPKLGDLLFFDQSGRSGSHVGIYIGDGKFVHAPSSGKHVRVDSLSRPYWEKHLTGVRRIETTVAALKD